MPPRRQRQAASDPREGERRGPAPTITFSTGTPRPEPLPEALWESPSAAKLAAMRDPRVR
eukprot:scaffold487_cov344-Prasinococcus_capsulatus_cf.AAC.1